MLCVADVVRLPFADRSFDLVFGSPPYSDARSYGIGAQRGCQEWIDWMLAVTTESLRVCKGPLLWVCAGVTRDRTYWPACEGLLYEWWKRGGSCDVPCFWVRHGIPGSGGDQSFKRRVEYVLHFKREGLLPWSDNTAMGKPPVFGPGGDPSNRKQNGERIRKQQYKPPEIANPGNWIEANVGGGALGDSIAHESEAPFPERLAEWFIRSLCPEGGIVLDPFSGSGTTVKVAQRFKRRGVGCDIRLSQAILGQRRLKRTQVELFA